MSSDIKQGLHNKTKDRPLVERVHMATNFFQRLKGLLGTENLANDEGLFLRPCKSIHMFGMKYPIDAIFLSKELKVVGLVENIQPNAVSKHYSSALSCLELAAGQIGKSKIEIGDQLEWKSPSTETD